MSLTEKNVNSQADQSYDVFISYRHESGYYVSHIIYTKLCANGYTVFMDKTMDSCKYEEKIHSAILHSRNYLVVLFPGDEAALGDEMGWLHREATWALENPNINIVPVMCEGFEWPKNEQAMTESIRKVQKNNGIPVHKDYSLDADLDKLCDSFLKNVHPSKPQIKTEDFFKYNLETRTDVTPCRVDMAFHAGAPWLMPGAKNGLLAQSLERGVRWRVLINTVEAAESIARHMRDENAMYVSFEQARAGWKRLAERYPECLEVRECRIPLIHVHHAVKFAEGEKGGLGGELHVKYYAYNNIRLDNAFEHTVSSYSPYYSIYDDEFEFLWNQSDRL